MRILGQPMMTDAAVLAAVVHSSHDAIVTKTVDGVITSWNPAAERIFGYAADDAIGRPITMLFPPNRLGEETELQRRIRAGERVEDFETTRLRKDGSPVPVSVTLSPILDTDGRIAGISKTARDLSSRKEAEHRLGAHEKRLEITLASIGDGVITTGTDGRITFMNAVAEAITGWATEAARGRPLPEVFRIVNEATGREAENPVARVLRDGVIVGLANHTVLIARDGTRRPIDDSAAPIHDDRGQLFGVVLVFRDVTDRRRTEHGLRRLAAIVESSDDAIIGKTPSGIITSWNRGAERMFGYTAAEMIDQPITMLVPPDRVAEEADLLARIARGERVDHYQTARIRKDGARIDVSVTLSPICDDDGVIVGVSKIARDVTQQLRLAEQERAARREAEDANRLKDDFLATLSHELRTPLNAILGWVRMLSAGHLDADGVRRAVQVIERNAVAQVQLVDDLLDTARIASGKLRLDVRSVDLSAVVEAAVDSVRFAAEARGVRLQTILDPRAGPIAGDPGRLQQVVWNLLSNAIKFTPRGGRVLVRTQRVNSHVEIVVCDTGQGIAPEILPHVFERFRQGESGSTRSQGGLGLGLALVRDLVAFHGGTVAAQSPGAGQGTTFAVRLPTLMHADLPAFAGPPRTHPTADRDVGPPEPGMLPGLRILVIEDDPSSVELLSRILGDQAAEVRGVLSANEALELLSGWRPDVIVSDIEMPMKDGYAFVRELRRLPVEAGSDVPAIALTAYGRTEDRIRALSAGYQQHVVKPVEPAELVAVIASVARRGRPPG